VEGFLFLDSESSSFTKVAEEPEFGRFQKDVWAFSPLRNTTIFTNSEEK